MVSDSEVFIPVDETSKGGVVKELRLCTGFGYRESFSWQYEVSGSSEYPTRYYRLLVIGTNF